MLRARGAKPLKAKTQTVNPYNCYKYRMLPNTDFDFDFDDNLDSCFEKMTEMNRGSNQKAMIKYC